MIDPDAPIDDLRITAVRHHATQTLGVFFDARVVDRVCECIIGKVIDGAIGDGVPYRDLVRDAGVPSWASHIGLLGPILDLVSLRSYEREAVLVSALTRATRDRLPPTEEFCRMLEQLGLVKSHTQREPCLEVWDHHWKKAVSRLESRQRGQDDATP